MANKELTMTVPVPSSFTAKVRGVDFPFNPQTWSEAGVRKALEYGFQRIMNDSAASAKNDSEAVELAKKREANLKDGIIRASGTRIGDPVKRRAMELAEGVVRKSKGFAKWLANNSVKASDKTATKAVNEKVAAMIAEEGNQYMAQAKIDVESQKGLEIDEIEFD